MKRFMTSTPLEEMHPTGLQILFNALDHCEQR